MRRPGLRNDIEVCIYPSSSYSSREGWRKCIGEWHRTGSSRRPLFAGDWSAAKRMHARYESAPGHSIVGSGLLFSTRRPSLLLAESSQSNQPNHLKKPARFEPNFSAQLRTSPAIASSPRLSRSVWMRNMNGRKGPLNTSSRQ